MKFTEDKHEEAGKLKVRMMSAELKPNKPTMKLVYRCHTLKREDHTVSNASCLHDSLLLLNSQTFKKHLNFVTKKPFHL